MLPQLNVPLGRASALGGFEFHFFENPVFLEEIIEATPAIFVLLHGHPSSISGLVI
jgi:hypothetical protein